MTARSISILTVLIFFFLALPSFAFDFGIKDIVKDEIEDIVDVIPDLNLGLDDEDPITTSLKDAVTEVPFLDDYEPPYFLPMGELPRGPGGSFLLMPGCFEIKLESYCLHAGAHGPGEGDGYLYAPLKGPKASIIRNILVNSAKNPDIPQRDIQVLIWAILARTKISDMNPSMQATAAQLLTSQELVELNGTALDVLKGELYERAFGKLPADVRRVMQVKAELRSKLTSGIPSYGELERIAVPTGDIELGKDSREVPSGRWSFHPDGYFIRFFPRGYSETRVQVSVPDLCMIERDGSERITAVGDAWGNLLEIDYSGGAVAYTFTGPKSGEAWETLTGSWTGSSGAPSGFSSWMSNHEKEVKAVCGSDKDIDEVLDMGRLAYMVEHAVDGDAGDAAVRLVKQAWQDAVCEVLGVADGESLSELVGKAPVDMLFPMMGGTMPGIFASGSLKPVIFAARRLPKFDNLENMRRMRAREAEWEEMGRRARERRKLKEFVPDKGAATPGNTGRQRLGVSNRPKDDGSGNNGPNGPKPNSYNSAKDGMKNFKRGISGAKAIGAPIAGPGAGAGMSGFAIPLALSSFMVGKSTDMWYGAIDALGKDPPDPNYDEYADNEIPEYDYVQASADVPQARADAFNVLLDACMYLNTSLRAAVSSIDKHGGARAAGDAEWIIRQAEAVVFYKRLSGVYMYDVAEALLALLDELHAEGFDDIIVTADSFREYQDDLRANGFSEDELNAARVVGLTEAQIQDSLNEILGADPDEVAGSVMDAWEVMADILYMVGWDLYSQWDVVIPGEWEAGFSTLYVSP